MWLLQDLLPKAFKNRNCQTSGEVKYHFLVVLSKLMSHIQKKINTMFAYKNTFGRSRNVIHLKVFQTHAVTALIDMYSQTCNMVHKAKSKKKKN